MKNKNKLVLALIIASATTTIFPENVSFASVDASTNVEITEKQNQDGKIVDTYTINKTDDKIKNPEFGQSKTDFSKLQESIEKIMGENVVLEEENVKKYNIAIENAIKVLNTRLSEVSFIIEKPNNKEENNSLENKDDQKHENGSSKNNKIIGEKVKAENFIKDSDFENKSLEKENKKSLNVKTGVGSLKGALLSLSFALVGLFKTKRK